MARKSNRAQPGAAPQPTGSLPLETPVAGTNPLGTVPWGEGGYNPQGYSAEIIRSLGPAAQVLLTLEQALTTAILEGLASTEKAIGQVDTDFRLAMASAMTPAITAQLAVQNQLQNAISGGLAQAAQYVSAAVNEPIHLVQASGYAPTPQLPPALGGIGGLSPRVPLYAGGAGAMVAPFAMVPSGNPAAMNGGAIADGGNPGPAATANPTPTPSSPSSLPSAGLLSVAPTQSTSVYQPGMSAQDEVAAMKTAALGAGCSPPMGDVCALYSLPCNPPPSGPGWDVRYAADGSWVATNYEACYGQPAPTPTPTPTPPAPTPTPTVPTPTPTPPPAPTPTPTPSPLPPPVYPPDLPVPPPTPTPIDCPPGSSPLWHPIGNSGYWTCEPTTTPTPPEPPLPPPEPPPDLTPPPSTNGVGGGATCGMTRKNPCFQAANPPDDDGTFPAFHTTPGIARMLTDLDGPPATARWTKPIVIQANGVIVDNASNITDCTLPYQYTLVDPTGDFSKMFVGLSDIDQVIKDASANLSKAQGTAVWYFLAPLSYIGRFGITLFNQAIKGVVALFSQTSTILASIVANQAALNALNLLTLGGLSKVQRIMSYSNDLTMPVGLPTPGEAASAWLGAEIDECTFRTYVMAGDSRYEPFLAVTKSQKYKFSPLELYTCFKRNGLVRGTIDSRLREVGSLHHEDRSEIDALFNYVPSSGDLIRYMVRDVENQDVITTFQTDKGFGDNFVGPVKAWADMQGLSQDVMVREWRAHWSIPSPTQLYEMLHRLRHDPQWGGPDKVTSDVRKALVQQDILPYWIERLMAVSYHPLTRTDLYRAYERGWINDDVFLSGMYANGYSDDDAGVLLRFVRSEQRITIRNDPYVRLYADADLSESQLRQSLLESGWSDSALDDAVGIATYERSLRQQREVLRELDAQFKSCRISEEDFRSDAEAMGIPTELINHHLEVVSLASLCGTRRESVATLLSLLDAGTIGYQTYHDRMLKLKFDEVAIEYNLLKLRNTQAKRQAQADAAARKREAAQEKADAKQQMKLAQEQLKAAQTAEEKAAALAAKQQAQVAAQAAKMQALAEKNERSRQARNRILMAATDDVVKNLSMETAEAGNLVQSIYEDLQIKFMLSQNEAATAVKLAAAKVVGGTTADLLAWAEAVAQGALREPWTLAPALVPTA